MTSWIGSARTLICIHKSNSKVKEGWQRGLLCHSFHIVRPKSCQKKMHGTGKNRLTNMSSAILSWGNVWNMCTKALIQDQKFDTCCMALGVTSCPQWLPQWGCTQISMREVLMQKLPSLPSKLTRKHQCIMRRLPLSVRPELIRGIGLALAMAFSEKWLSQTNTLEKRMTQCWWHSSNSCMSFGRKLDS